MDQERASVFSAIVYRGQGRMENVGVAQVTYCEQVRSSYLLNSFRY